MTLLERDARIENRKQHSNWGTLERSLDDMVCDLIPVIIVDSSYKGLGFSCREKLTLGSQWTLKTEDGNKLTELETVWGDEEPSNGFYHYGAEILIEESK